MIKLFLMISLRICIFTLSFQDLDIFWLPFVMSVYTIIVCILQCALPED